MTFFPGLPPDGSAHGAEIDRLLTVLHLFMATVFTAWFAYFVATLVRYRAAKHPKPSYRAPKGMFIAATVATVLIVEIVLDFFFAIPIWSRRSAGPPDPRESTLVRIVAEQFAWNVHYPGRDGVFGRASADLVDPFNPLGLDRDDPAAKDDITLLNRLVVPAGTPVVIELTSKDVIHSLNIPVYRIKQDAVPGLMSPVWFVPVMTTAQVRGEMASDFSVVKALSTERTIALPPMERIDIAQGAAPQGYIAVSDIEDSSGGMILMSGEEVGEQSIEGLRDAGIRSIEARRRAGIDMYISTRPYSDPAGTVVLPAWEGLTEDAVTALLRAGHETVEARRRSHTDPWVLLGPLNSPDGTLIAGDGAALDEEVISSAARAGIASIRVAPATPTEIACAQLCGLGHYQMRAVIDVLEPRDYRAWFDSREDELLGVSGAGEDLPGGNGPTSKKEGQ